ncbi:MAG: aromatic acid/H+ symport family MFS transporter [Gemmatimonadaceae bacterium]
MQALIDATLLGNYQRQILLLLGLAVLMDGFDVQAIGFVAPAIIQQWGVNKASLGPVFGAGLFGMLVGSLMLSVLADRVGRRPVLIGATIFFAACMLLTPQVTTLGELRMIRFVTGIGLGAIMPNARALAGEFSPRRARVTLMMLVSCGFTVGAVLGGMLSAALIPSRGWESVFYVGGAVPLVAGIAMWIALPESMHFRVTHGVGVDVVARTLSRIDGVPRTAPHPVYLTTERTLPVAPVSALFHDGRTRQTLLLWAVNFLNLINLYFLSNWLPTIATASGLSTSRALLLGTTLQLGGVVGTIVLGGVIDRAGFRRVLVLSFMAASLAIALIGAPSLPLALLFVVVGITGFCIVGGPPAVNALAAEFYPTPLRSTGLGESLGVGRIGSIIGPVLGGALIALRWSNRSLFLAVASPALLSALCVLLMPRDRAA